MPTNMIFRNKGKQLLLTASVIQFLFSNTVFAQEQREKDVQNSDITIEDIVVTARKREENLQDTPISVTAITGASLEKRGLSNISQIADFTPNLTFQSGASLGSGTSSSIYIRGIGQADFALTVDPGVGLYVDGVYVARSVGGVLDVLEIQRIEVLRGPQGTLFGKNTIGGAINIISQRPDDELSGYIESTVGSFNRVDIKGAISVPFSDTFRTKLSVARLVRDGFVKKVGLPFIDASNDVANGFRANGLTGFSGIVNDSENVGLLGGGKALGDKNAIIMRFQADWELASNVEVMLDFDYTRKREQSAPRLLTNITPIDTINFSQNPFANQLGWQAFAGYQYLLPGEINPQSAAQRAASLLGVDIFDILPTTGDLKYVADPSLRSSFQGASSPSRSDLDLWGLGLRVNWDVSDDVQLKSITAYRSIDNTFARDTDGSIFLINDSTNFFTSRQFSQELQFSGISFNDRLNWIIGGYYSNETGNDTNTVSLFPITIAGGGQINNNSYALFGQATYEVTDRLDITGGLRWSQDAKSFSTTPGGVRQHVSNIVGIGMLPTPPNPGAVLTVLEVQASRSFVDVSPQATVSYHITDDTLLYGSFSSGYKSGGFNQRLAPLFQVIPSFDAETINVYEVGLKLIGFDHRLRFNIDGFVSKYDNLQLTGLQNVSPIVENAAKANISGIEVEVNWVVSRHLKIDSGFSYLSAKYDEFNTAVATDAGGVQTSASQRLADSGINIDNLLPNAPKYNFNIGAELSYEIFGGEATFRADASYRSKIALDAANFLLEGSLTLLNLSANFVPSNSTWIFTLAGRNVTNKRYNVSGFADPAGIGIFSAQPAAPAEWSLSIRKTF
ncbi:MAG: hypothetical protein COA85_13350 [Robiginitomaculum sp.]|nr:MAG: hypothetical protein COA85_13350 [Robiginitomaculum sp.]